MPNHKPITSNSKKRKHCLCDKQMPARKHRLNYSNQLRRTNYDNIIKILPTIKNSTGLQSDPTGNVINLKVVSATFLVVCFVCLNDSTFETRKNVFYFTSKTLFVLEITRL